MFAWRDKSKKRKIATEAATPPARHVPPLTSEPLHSLRGTGSSSKVLYKLGAPVTLAGELDSELAITRRPSDASADSVSVGAGTQQSQRSGSHTSSSRATPSKPTLPLLRRRRSSLADIQDMPNSRQSSAMSSDSLLPSPSLIASSASSLNANDTPPNSAPSHMIGFPESGSSTLEYKPSHRSAASSKKSYASSNGRRYEKHRPTHSPIPSVNSNTKSDEIPTLQSTPKLYSSPPSSKLRSTPHEASAEDATEEIVPWMFDNSSRHEDEPDTVRPQRAPLIGEP